jgi:hypothetical protein
VFAFVKRNQQSVSARGSPGSGTPPVRQPPERRSCATSGTPGATTRIPVGRTSARCPPSTNSYRRASDHIQVLRFTTDRSTGLVSTVAVTLARAARTIRATVVSAAAFTPSA